MAESVWRSRATNRLSRFVSNPPNPARIAAPHRHSRRQGWPVRLPAAAARAVRPPARDAGCGRRAGGPVPRVKATAAWKHCATSAPSCARPPKPSTRPPPRSPPAAWTPACAGPRPASASTASPPNWETATQPPPPPPPCSPASRCCPIPTSAPTAPSSTPSATANGSTSCCVKLMGPALVVELPR